MAAPKERLPGAAISRRLRVLVLRQVYSPTRHEGGAARCNPLKRLPAGGAPGPLL